MAAWRRKALALFPELKQELNKPDYTIYQLYFDLLPMSRHAHDVGDIKQLRSIYGYAEWCSNQRTKELWNAAGVAFWEHVFDQRQYWERVVPWLSPQLIKEIWVLWEYFLESDELDEVKTLIEHRRIFLYRENIYHSGLIKTI